jgi:hypothetical protein
MSNPNSDRAFSIEERTQMATKLDKSLRREIEINDKAYTLTIDPNGLKLTEKGHRKGHELTWKQILGSDGGLPPGSWTPAGNG